MITVNPHYRKLQSSYLFSQISKIVAEVQQKNPALDIIRLGIGDVTRPLAPSIVEAFSEGVREMARDESFRGYGPEQGYDFLREAIAAGDFTSRGVSVAADEIIVSDGSKCDVGNFQELFDLSARIAVPDPVYPVYVDTNVMAGRTGAFVDGRYEGLIYMDSLKENGFVPPPPSVEADVLYLCFPNNPTGAVATHAQLAQFVAYAKKHKALILFDAAYCEFIRDPSLPRSIFEIEGARSCAVEFRSFSKTAGFTGTRCAYTVIPKECVVFTAQGEGVSVRDLWLRRHTTKFNGVSYPVQKAAAAVYSERGKREVAQSIDYYMQNADIIRSTMRKKGFAVYGGENAPYIWVASDVPSWDLFRTLLEKTGVVTTPGAGFGKRGEGYLRISAFNRREKVEEAVARLEKFM